MGGRKIRIAREYGAAISQGHPEALFGGAVPIRVATDRLKLRIGIDRALEDIHRLDGMA